MTVMQRLKLAYTLLGTVPKIRGMLLYIFFISLSLPNTEVYLTYSNEWQFHISGWFESLCMMVMFMISVFYLVQYTSFRLIAPIRVFLYVGVMMRLMSLVFFAYIV